VTENLREFREKKTNIIRTIVRYERVKKKGYVRMTTNMGPLNFELHCEYAPKTCENFIKLCQKGYYDGTKFHRSIRHFMIQGGDPLGTGNEVYHVNLQEWYFVSKIVLTYYVKKYSRDLDFFFKITRLIFQNVKRAIFETCCWIFQSDVIQCIEKIKMLIRPNIYSGFK
jgi:hypothetical protein